MAILKVDIDEINSLITFYNEQRNKLIEIEKSIKDAVKEMKETAWDSNGGEAVLNRLDSTWCKNLDLYIDFIENLETCLSNARDEFGVLVEEAKKLEYLD